MFAVLKIALLMGILVLLYLSLCWRVQHRQRIWEQNREIPVEPQESAFSQAIVELLATAGGIYLALLLLQNFLQITIPEQVMILGLKLEPMAAVALVIAIFQPYLLFIFRRSS